MDPDADRSKQIGHPTAALGIHGQAKLLSSQCWCQEGVQSFQQHVPWQYAIESLEDCAPYCGCGKHSGLK